ncbi:MAG: phytoene/squalene synthase family protein [Methylococcaceae bacterium]
MNQMELLIGVSRTFALTIPQLPEKVKAAVVTAYLLCRIADTIEDEPTLSLQGKAIFFSRFESVIKGVESAEIFSSDLLKCLSQSKKTSEILLIKYASDVVNSLYALSKPQQIAVIQCVTGMLKGMASFQLNNPSPGLVSKKELNTYCYYVAGIVGEMLTTVFCDYSTAMEKQRDQLMPLSRSFGQGLQMTNILKDIWEDLENGISWLPRDVFQATGYDLTNLSADQSSNEFNAGINILIEQACNHLYDAMRYTQLVPANETGIRKFCYQSIGMAVLTLRNIYYSPGYQNGNRVKISRKNVRTVVWLSQFAASSDRAMNSLFKMAVRNLRKPEYNQAKHNQGCKEK